MGDGGGCPDKQGRFNCVDCGRKLAKGASSALCHSCRGSVLERTERWDQDDFFYDPYH